MHACRSWPLAALICALLLAAAPPAQAREHRLLLEGTYLGHETGDFSYLILENRGTQHHMVCDFLMLQALDALQPTLPIVVEFSTTWQYVVGAGEEVEMHVVHSIFVPDEYAPDFGIRLSRQPRP